ncbi:MAG: hypothetical protein RLZZ152_242, partial [Pseudomonadota bacterium]
MRTERLAHLALWLGLALLVAAPFIGLYPIFMMKALCYAIFAMAFNLLMGFTGLLSFGHAAYFGAAAYATGWLVRSLYVVLSLPIFRLVRSRSLSLGAWVPKNLARRR